MVTIRLMTPEDVYPIYSLGLRCFKVYDVPYQSWTVREVAYHLEAQTEHAFVAVEDGQVIGFSLGADTYDTLIDTAQVEWTAVAPEYHGRGIAQMLLDANCASLFAKGKLHVITDVVSGNTPTEKLVERVGFHVVATVNFWMKDADVSEHRDRLEEKHHSDTQESIREPRAK